MENPKKMSADPLDLLSSITSGTLTVGVNGLPFLKVDAESRSVGVEARGVKECGIRLSSIVEIQGGGRKGVSAILKGSESAAKGLSEKGWKLVLSDRGSTMLTMGRGVSKVTGHVRVNPLKLRKILEIL